MIGREGAYLLTHPEGVGDDDELGAFKPVQVGPDGFMEPAAAILFLPLKRKRHIDGQGPPVCLLSSIISFTAYTNARMGPCTKQIHCQSEGCSMPQDVTHTSS